MASDRASGTQGYTEEARDLIRQYESLSFADVHASCLHLIPTAPGMVLDIGSGIGRGAAAFAAMGHHVTAADPTAELRLAAEALHPSPLIDWVDDSLPELVHLNGSRKCFDVVMATAVWMHLDEAQRHKAMPRVARLLGPGGVWILSLRHGPVSPGHRMFNVSGQETTELARAAGLSLELGLDAQHGRLGRPGITWTQLAFSEPW